MKNVVAITDNINSLLGSDSFIYVQVEGAGQLLARSSGNTSLQADQPIGLALDPKHLHLFDVRGQALV